MADRDIESFELQRHDPSHVQRIAAEKKTNIYFIPGADKNGAEKYVFAVCSALLHDDFMAALRVGVIPDYAVVVESGDGLPPPDAVRSKMREYYGFEDSAA